MFRFIYAIIKPFLTKRTTDKLKVVTDLNDLQLYINRDQLMEEHLGTSKYVYKYE